MYEFCIEGDYNTWINKEVLELDKEAEQVQIMACVNLFDVGIKIEHLNKVKNQVIKFPENKEDDQMFIKFLLAGGHYDLLYEQNDKQISFCMKNN